MSPTRLVGRLVRGAAEVVRHPLGSAAYAAGLVRGTARSVAEIARGGTTVEDDRAGAEPHPGPAEPPRPDTGIEPQVAARPSAPEPPAEPVAHEPKAVSRDSAHGRAGRTDDDLVDDWAAEADEDEPPEPRAGSLAADEPVDEGTLKAVRSEAEMMRRAADPHPE